MKTILKALPNKANLVSFALGFAASATPMPLGAYPFGIAYLMSTPSCGAYSFAGAIAGCLIGKRLIPMSLLCVCLCCASFREIARRRGTVSMTARMMIALVTGLIASAEAFAVFTQPSDMLLFAACNIFIAPAFTYMFRRASAIGFETASKLDEGVLLCCAFAVNRFFSQIDVFGAPLGMASGCFITLLFARRRGFLYGGTCGFACGLACGSPTLGALGITGITYGILEDDNSVLAAALAFMLSLAAYGYLSDFTALIPAAILLLVSSILFLCVRNRISRAIPFPLAKARSGGEVPLKRFASAFSSLSNIFFSVGEKQSPQLLRESVKGAVVGFCDSCDGCGASADDIATRLCRTLREDGAAEVTALPDSVRVKCPNTQSMVSAVNRIPIDEMNRTGGKLKMLAEEYGVFASLLDGAAGIEMLCVREDRSASRDASRLLSEMGIAHERVSVTGGRMKTVEAFGVHPERIASSPKKISGMLSGIMRVPLSEPEFVNSDGVTVMRLHTSARIRTEAAKITEARGGETVCGDTLNCFETADLRFVCLVADGMGSGEDAALTSRLCALVLEKLLTLGADTADALKALNQALVSKDEEVFTTVDLLEIDRVTGDAKITKAGAAPSYLVRDGACRVLQSRTPPMGIMGEVVCETIPLTLRKGDMLVMISDGVLPQHGDDYLPTVLESIKGVSARDAASAVAASAHELSGSADDKTVCVVKIS